MQKKCKNNKCVRRQTFLKSLLAHKCGKIVKLTSQKTKHCSKLKQEQQAREEAVALMMEARQKFDVLALV